MPDSGSLKEKFNINELVYDSAMLLFPFLSGGTYNQLAKSTPFGIPFMQLFLMGTVYFLPLLIGKMYNMDFKDSPPVIKKCVLAILFASTLFAYFNLLYMTIHAAADTKSSEMFIFLTATVFLIMGPMAGLAFTGREFRNEKLSAQMMIFLFTMGILPLFYVLVSGEKIFGDINGLLVFFLITGLFIADVLFILFLYLVYITCKKLSIRAGIYKHIISAAGILTPFCISFILIFFNIHSDRLFLGGIGVHGAGSIILVIFLYLVTGVLPLRVMMMLAPPVKPANILTGILSAGVLIYIITLR